MKIDQNRVSERRVSPLAGRMSIVALKPMRLVLREGLYEESVTVAPRRATRKGMDFRYEFAQHVNSDLN